MSPTQLRVRIDAGVARIDLDGDAQLTAVAVETRDALSGAVAAASADDSVQIVVLGGWVGRSAPGRTSTAGSPSSTTGVLDP